MLCRHTASGSGANSGIFAWLCLAYAKVIFFLRRGEPDPCTVTSAPVSPVCSILLCRETLLKTVLLPVTLQTAVADWGADPTLHLHVQSPTPNQLGSARVQDSDFEGLISGSGPQLATVCTNPLPEQTFAASSEWYFFISLSDDWLNAKHFHSIRAANLPDLRAAQSTTS